LKQVLGAIRKADERYHMIRPGDKICVGVSGGKDSMLLMYGLSLYQKFCKAPFELQAVMLDLGLSKENTEAVEAFAKKIGVPLDIQKTHIGEIVFDIRKEKNPCALCATLRRGALNNAAVEHGCNLVALGHNREDVLETFLLSLFYESRLNTFGPVTYLDRKGVTLIRPFVFLPERYILSVVNRLEIPTLKACCTAAGNTKREEMKKLLESFSEIFPDVENRMMRAISDTDSYGMWDRLRLPPRDLQTPGEICKDPVDEVDLL